MSPIEQAKALAAYWRESAQDLEYLCAPYAAKARETAAVLEKLIDAVQRP